MTLLITLDALQTLDAIERRHSFAAAAEELHRVPSAVSYTINKLEDDLGVQLFTRTPRGIDLTQAGEALLKDARSICGLADQAGGQGAGRPTGHWRLWNRHV